MLKNTKPEKVIAQTLLFFIQEKKMKRHLHKKRKEVHIILAGEVEFNNRVLRKGDVNIFEIGQPHGYINKSNKPSKMLCIGIPKYDPNDEIPVK